MRTIVIYFDKYYAPTRHDVLLLPGQILFVVVPQEYLAFSNQPAFHFQTNQQQSTIFLGNFHVLVEIERQKLIPVRRFSLVHDIIIFSSRAISTETRRITSAVWSKFFYHLLFYIKNVQHIVSGSVWTIIKKKKLLYKVYFRANPKTRYSQWTSELSLHYI